MKDKLYKYLKSRGGCASSVAIVGQLLNIRGARRDVAEKIVVSWVKNHPLFVSDGLGNWYINPEAETKGTLLNEVLFNLVDIRGNAGDLSNSSLLEIAVCQIQNGKAKKINFDIAVRGINSLQSSEPFAHEAKPWQEVLDKLLSILEGGVLTGFHLVRVRNFIYTEAMRYFGEYLAFEELSLRDLSRRLYPKQRIKTPSDLATLFEVQYFESDELKVQVNNLANLFLALLNKLPDRGLTSLDEVLTFQLPKRKQVNLEDKKINRRFLENLPQSPGVYLLKNQQEEIIYIGKAKNLKPRVGSYFYAREKLEVKLAEIWAKIYDIEIVELGSELEAFLEEQKLIKKFRPEINLQIEVHVKSGKDLHLQNLIIFLPARRKGYLNLFCVNTAGKSMRLTVSQKRSLSTRAKEKLRRLFFSARIRKPNSAEQEQSELILRWFVKNKDMVSWLDMNNIGDFSDCLRLIEKYKKADFTQQGRVIFY